MAAVLVELLGLARALGVTILLMALVFGLMASTLAGKAVSAIGFSEASHGLNISRTRLYGSMAVCAALYAVFSAPMSVAHDQGDVR